MCIRDRINTDEGARRLGEVALVPHSSPISQSNLLFYNTLFDENAACHIALGQCYSKCFKNGDTLSKDQIIKNGGNSSMIHVDWMIGSETINIDGIDFDGTAILGRYRSPDLTMNDPGIRKNMQRVIVNYAPESSIDADLFIRYDYESRESARPAAYPLDSSDIAAIYGTATYGSASSASGTYGGASQPLVRQPVEGSGFAVALRVNDGGTTAPYSLKGFQLEYQLGERR